MSAVMISQIEVTDKDAFQEYLTKTQKIAGSYGAELLFRGRMDAVLNGEPANHQMVVIARFPDMETIRRWHASDEYQAIVPLREKGSRQLMTAYQAMS